MSQTRYTCRPAKAVVVLRKITTKFSGGIGEEGTFIQDDYSCSKEESCSLRFDCVCKLMQLGGQVVAFPMSV